MGTQIGLVDLLVILAAIAIYVVFPNSPGIHISLGPIDIQRDFEIKQGWTYEVEFQVLLEADLADGQELEAGALDVAASIIENRVQCPGRGRALGADAGNRRIIVELPGVGDPDQAIATIKRLPVGVHRCR